MHTKTIQKIQKAYIKTYEEDVNICKDIENSQGQGAFFFLKTPVHLDIATLQSVTYYILQCTCLVQGL